MYANACICIYEFVLRPEVNIRCFLLLPSTLYTFRVAMVIVAKYRSTSLLSFCCRSIRSLDCSIDKSELYVMLGIRKGPGSNKSSHLKGRTEMDNFC